MNGFRFYLHSHEPGEPPHIHVDYGGVTAKGWLHDTAIACNMGFS